ncbi:MAG: bile acid:sodium symporter family protein [Oceanipulchritudo sp.]
MSLIRRNAFVLGLLGAVLVAFLFPELGAREGALKAGLLSKAGVMVIFLLQGLTLRTRELAGGFRHIRLHAFIQAWIFLLSPVVLVLMAAVLRLSSIGDLSAGFLFLALVPTTISSAVAFTGAAGGNVPAAIFNTTLSNVWGVFWVPTGCLLLFAGGGTFQTELIGPLLLKIAWLIVVPLLAGQLIRPFVFRRAWFQLAAPRFKLINHGIILFIVFAAFCQSFLSNAWDGVGAGALLTLLLLTLCAVLIVHAGNWLSSQWITSNHADRVSALFCGSQKTLAAGAPMAVAIFAGDSALSHVNPGLLLLPLLCYHPIQLLLAALLLPRLTR